MHFSEKLRLLREEHNLSQIELAKKIGVTERTIYNYETKDRVPKIDIVAKIAKVFGVTIDALTSDAEESSVTGSERDNFLQTAREQFGSRGKKEAETLLERASALFAGGELDEDAKEEFFQSLTNAFLTAKKEARKKFTNK
ncbi:DNA-binding transcriptional regulator, XRE-family HTH domain [Desulfonispora thiosulfatigenes DSM 11270]|uniref:DNA-binding transcriptional regulator, XRE-family HTH domain n=1 Tax=Desulfonispora thiosulfatigenes DSM 11270 TaxID=656914 RepID=A0A1W1UIW2_DESTI|nr:helix-turn-helix transcriptional regulator [Desulfonispora thiosulfatigenes]SMB81065.1 DNA-binding transcriptional regulator, XRE-family HTH domain [Desulfonispora thiosulfatigenes DSM 11270]